MTSPPGGAGPERRSDRDPSDRTPTDRSPSDRNASDANPEVDLGGADAVEGTTYVVGDGTEPESRPTGAYVARGAAANGGNIALWVVVAVAALIALVYAIGIFR